MTRQDAINHLKNDWFRSLGGQLCVDGDKIDNFLEAVGMGIKELSIPESSNQAQIEKEKNEPLSEERFEEICEAVHNGWWEEKKRQGVTDHPDMIPYSELSEEVKEYDRVTTRRVLDALGLAYRRKPKEAE